MARRHNKVRAQGADFIAIKRFDYFTSAPSTL